MKFNALSLYLCLITITHNKSANSEEGTRNVLPSLAMTVEGSIKPILNFDFDFCGVLP